MKKILKNLLEEYKGLITKEKLILTNNKKAGAQKTKKFSWIAPMAAMLTKKYFSDPTWIYECKFDGERLVMYKNGTNVKIMTRNKHLVNSTYPELVKAAEKQSASSFIIDGEVVAFKHGVTSFEKLNERMRLTKEASVSASTIKIYFYIFDIMYLDGYNITRLPLIRRKTILKNAISFKDPLRYTEHKTGDGVAYYHHACRIGWEGIMAKNAASTYQSKRSRDWLKFKCVQMQELVVGGYTHPSGDRQGFGALLLGYYDGKTLKFAGKVGTGFNDALLADLGKQLAQIEQTKCPFVADEKLPKKDVHWVKPKIVAQIGFEEWTKYGRLRQPRFLGLRDDKKAKDVVREDIKQLVPTE